MRRTALLLGLTLFVLPSALAHASPDPLETEVQLLADDTDDSYAQYDGYDIQDVYVREAFFPALGHGLVFRFYLYGGYSAAPVASSLPLELDVEAAGSTQTYQLSTSDGSSWAGDMQVIEQDFEAAEGGIGLQGYLQGFIPLIDLGVGLGDVVGPFTVRTYADDDLRDISPGGRPIPGTDGAVMTPGDTSRVTTETITLTGPVGYTRSTAKVEGGNVTVTVQNLITTLGQHIAIMPDAPSGWTVTDPDPPAESVEPGQHPTFTFTATARPGSEDLTLMIESDLGGLETLTLSADSVPTPTETSTGTGTSGTDGGSNDTPVPITPVLLAIAALAMSRRR